MNNLDFYEKQGFDLVQIAKNEKFPIEEDWTNKSHKNKLEWSSWINQGFNIGVKTGKISNITVIDIDIQPIPVELEEILKDEEFLIQQTPNGYHLFFLYDEELPKTTLKKVRTGIGLPVDIENDGGQVLITPSVINGKDRTFFYKYKELKKPVIIIDFKTIKLTSIPVKFKEYLKEQLSPKSSLEPVKGTNIEELKPENLQLNIIPEGTRNNVIMYLGGILRKELNIQ